jgi:hypothetical protein
LLVHLVDPRLFRFNACKIRISLIMYSYKPNL